MEQGTAISFLHWVWWASTTSQVGHQHCATCAESTCAKQMQATCLSDPARLSGKVKDSLLARQAPSSFPTPADLSAGEAVLRPTNPRGRAAELLSPAGQPAGSRAREGMPWVMPSNSFTNCDKPAGVEKQERVMPGLALELLQHLPDKRQVSRVKRG